MRHVALLGLLTMPLIACSTSGSVSLEAIDSALCAGLQEPVDTFVDALVQNAEKTPAEVINEGTRVVKGYDAGCNP